MVNQAGYRSIAYFVNWAIYARKHRPQDLKVENLTHILYAFANIRTDSGEVYLTDTWADQDIHWEGDSWNDTGTNLYGCLKQFNLLKQKNRTLKVILSIGGWTYSANFAKPTSSEAGRKAIADSAVALLSNYGFDGLDFDWEFPASQAEAQNYVLLLQTCREALDTYAAALPQPYHFELSVATSAGPDKYNLMDIAGMDRYLDFWNLMAYDYAGSWDATAGHQANLRASSENPAATPFSTVQAVDDYKKYGVCASKIVLGMPLYGRAFENTDGPGKSYSGIGEGTWERGVYDYKVLPLMGSEEKYDGDAGATYSYDPVKKEMVSYDNTQMAMEKAGWIKEQLLGGVMWWETSADRVGDQSLIQTVARNLSTLECSENCLDYPKSKFGNLRNKFC
ncbi:Endochitinase [Podosphaera aphanis]|nr:Endochitinase [Podosphaera aphanis]